MWAVSVAQVIVCFLTCIYYVALMAWSFSFFFDSFTSTLPWMLPNTRTNTTVDSISEIWDNRYFYEETLQLSSGIQEQGFIVPRLVLCLFFSYLFLYFAAWKGIKSTGKMVYVTCILPYVILFILLIKGLTLEGAGLGIDLLFKPNFEKGFASAAIWKNAAI
jgi:SNF family Na+-dependent transporter